MFLCVVLHIYELLNTIEPHEQQKNYGLIKGYLISI
jgi:hypothetical protein